MVHTNIIKIDHDKIQRAIRSAVALSGRGDGLEFIVMSADTQIILKKEIADSYSCFLGDTTVAELDIDYSAKYMGIPIAISNSLGLGEIKIV